MDLNNFRKAELFNDRGKWKYEVWLDYTDCDYSNPDLWGEACKALAKATANHVSGVTLSDVPAGWMLVVAEPISRYQHPIMVIGE